MTLINNNFKVFNEVTEQLSHGSACISEVGNSVRKYILHFQVIPMVTIMMHSLERIEMEYAVQKTRYDHRTKVRYRTNVTN